MAQRADGIVIARAPMILHRQAGEFVILRVALVIPGPIDQVDDVVDLFTGDRFQELQIIVLLKIGRQPAEQGCKGPLHPVHALELPGAGTGAARKLNSL